MRSFGMKKAKNLNITNGWAYERSNKCTIQPRLRRSQTFVDRTNASFNSIEKRGMLLRERSEPIALAKVFCSMKFRWYRLIERSFKMWILCFALQKRAQMSQPTAVRYLLVGERKAPQLRAPSLLRTTAALLWATSLLKSHCSCPTSIGTFRNSFPFSSIMQMCSLHQSPSL